MAEIESKENKIPKYLLTIGILLGGMLLANDGWGKYNQAIHDPTRHGAYRQIEIPGSLETILGVDLGILGLGLLGATAFLPYTRRLS